MKLYLIQHADAVPESEDPQRPLSAVGRGQEQSIADAIRPLGLAVAAIWHSSKARARETAEILSTGIASNEGLVERPGLDPGDRVRPMAREIGAMDQDIAIVGHLPMLSKLAACLLTGKKTCEVVAFRKAGIVCLSRDDEDDWRLAWIITPELLAGLQR